MSGPKLSTKERKDRGMRKMLMIKAGELIAEAVRFCDSGDDTWTLIYLQCAVKLVEAIRAI